MKLNRPSSKHRSSGERGFFLVVMMLMMAAILLIYLAANSRRLINLKQELRLVEQKQVQRLQHSPNVTTNNLPAPIVIGEPAP